MSKKKKVFYLGDYKILSMKFSAFAYLSIVLVAFGSCKKDEYLPVNENLMDLKLATALHDASNGVGNAYYLLPNSEDLGSIPQDPKNPLSAEKVLLGKLLFHETALAVNPTLAESKNTYSCASCHHLKGDFQAGRIQGIGDGGIGFGTFGEGRTVNPNYTDLDLDIQHIKTPSIVNSAYQELMLWNGQFGATGPNEGTESQWTDETPIANNHLGFQGLETQAIAGLAVHKMDVDEALVTELGYKEMFDNVFPNIPITDRYTKITAGLAIGAFERVVVANEAPFQQWLNGDMTALEDIQKEGAILFFGKAKCFECHNGPALNSMEFKSLGIKDLEGDNIIGSPDEATRKGRGGFTGKPEDMYTFKVPQLYNLMNSGFYGHGASFTSIKEIIDYKNKAVAENPNVAADQLSPEFVPLGLSDEEVSKITSFITYALYDDTLFKYEPASVLSQNCFPNNDAASKIDMGCD